MSLPWLQSQWIVDEAFSIDNTLTFSEKSGKTLYFSKIMNTIHMILVAYHRISIQKPWEPKSDLDIWIRRLFKAYQKVFFDRGNDAILVSTTDESKQV